MQYPSVTLLLLIKLTKQMLTQKDNPQKRGSEASLGDTFFIKRNLTKMKIDIRYLLYSNIGIRNTGKRTWEKRFY